jgi:hypothetical protein
MGRSAWTTVPQFITRRSCVPVTDDCGDWKRFWRSLAITASETNLDIDNHQLQFGAEFSGSQHEVHSLTRSQARIQNQRVANGDAARLAGLSQLCWT